MPRVDTDEFYRAALADHGQTARGLQWRSAYTQEVRFRVLRGFLPDDLSGVSLVDVGCGFGDLYLYLRGQGDAPGQYLGLDVMAPMVLEARRRTGREILLCDVLEAPLPEADYYLCSGAMNTLTLEETDRFIERCFAACRVAFVFNLLKGADPSGVFNPCCPERIARLGGACGARVERQDGYLATDFTMGFFKTARPA